MIDDLRIERLTYGGSGLGHHQGKAVFVPHTAPGDLVRCRVVREKKRYIEAELTEIITPSPQRRSPLCPVFGLCGGCQWQHLPYAEQTSWKETIFRDSLTRPTGLAAERFRPLVAAPDEWAYRSRAQFKCRWTDQGFVMGFYRRGSHYVIDIEHCPIVADELNEALQYFRRWLGEGPCPDKIPQVNIAVDDEGWVRVVVHVLDGREAALAAYLRPLVETVGYSLFFQSGRKETLTRITGEDDLHIFPTLSPKLRLAYGPGGFAQVNLSQNRNLVAAVTTAVETIRPKRVLDLYCGMGNFSLPIALWADEVVGIEDHAPSIRKAEQNALSNKLTNLRFYAEPAEGAAARHAQTGHFDLVVLDPPRTGAYPVVRELASLRPRHILYISCDPPTLARDLVPLLHNGYELQWSQPFDLFPQTYHTEGLTLLELKT